MKLLNKLKITDWIKIRRLYKSAFPRYERKPFWLIRRMFRKGTADVWMIEEGGSFAGLAITMNSGDMVLLDYFAVDEKKRSGGIGSRALKLLQEKYSDKRLFLEIESTLVHSNNTDERLRRKQFYLRNGMSELKIAVNLFGTDMELMGYNCVLTFEEYKSVYTDNFGKWAADKIKKKEHPEG